MKKKIFTTSYLMICDFSNKNLIRKISKTECSGKKMEARFGLSTKNFSENDVSHPMST